ncbi:MAG: hypothetical protein HeimC3_14630 [Candidatus Heimdallarchaeota archaeon LC_3]|jgi:AbrB family looped-hinge helix DNA binding protein|nr:MAG: hypothetical protein HeimC3_14630 [Candidatus Heimdallarchaeota archaeon LC_3]
MELLDIDTRGRITLPKKWRDKLKVKKMLAIQSKGKVHLIPVNSDPLVELKGSFKTTKSTKQLKKQALEELLKEVNS